MTMEPTMRLRWIEDSDPFTRERRKTLQQLWHEPPSHGGTYLLKDCPQEWRDVPVVSDAE